MSDNEQKKIFSRNLTRLLTERGKTQKEVADAISVSPQTFNTWCQGIALPRMGKVQRLAEYFNVRKSDLIDERTDDTTNKAPIVGSIPAGYPVFAQEDIEGYADIPYSDEENYFFLRVKGDSMEPVIHAGDLVLIRRQNWAEENQIVAARVNGDEATLKRYKRQGNMILLLPENQDYDPYVVPIEDFDIGEASIIGVALETRHKL